MSSMIPIEVLIRPISPTALSELLFDSLETLGIPAKSWREGGVARSIIGVASAVGAQGSELVSEAIGGLFLAFAKGVWLTAHAKDVYDVDRIEASFAAGFVTLSNEGGAVHTVGADELIVRSSNTGARYRVTEAFILGSGAPGSPTSITVAVSAVESGAASSVSVGEIDELETTLSYTTVANASAIIGSDAEPDEALRARCYLKRATWSPLGPRDAYEYAALTAKLPDGSPTNITRVRPSRYSSTGLVKVVCATPSGTPTAEALDAVEDAIESTARPDTVTVEVSGAEPVETAHSLILWCRGGSIPVIRARAQAALSALIAAWPIGGISKSEGGQGYLFSDAVAAAVVGSSPQAFDVDFVGGAVDIPLAFNEVAINTTTFDVRLV
jgi:phage-related baseplate assembly protein